MKNLILITLLSISGFASTYPDLEPTQPVQKKICKYTPSSLGTVLKRNGYIYTIFEDKVSDKVVIFSNNSEKLYTTKSEMKKYNLYNCKNLLEVIQGSFED